MSDPTYSFSDATTLMDEIKTHGVRYRTSDQFQSLLHCCRLVAAEKLPKKIVLIAADSVQQSLPSDPYSCFFDSLRGQCEQAGIDYAALCSLPLKKSDDPDEPSEQPVYSPVLVRMNEVIAEEIKWLWEGRIALGKLTLLVGNPGLGKSFLTLDIAARVSNAMKWPDDSGDAPLGGVVLISCEDDLADTIRPRLDAAGADCTRIVALEGVAVHEAGDKNERSFDLERDLPALLAAVESVDDCKLVIIDPISAYLGKTDSHKNAEVRSTLAPLTTMAAERGFAIIGVSHRRKSEGSAIHSTMGSIAFVAAARAAYLVEIDRDDKKRRLFLPMKNNIGEDRSGLAYVLSARHSGSQPCVEWCADPVEITADEAMAAKPKRGPKPEAQDEAVEFIRAALAGGPRPSSEVIEDAREIHGISKATLDRAKKVAKVVAYRPQNPGQWWWKLPGQEHIVKHILNPPSDPVPEYLEYVPPSTVENTTNDPPHIPDTQVVAIREDSSDVEPTSDWDDPNGLLMESASEGGE